MPAAKARKSSKKESPLVTKEKILASASSLFAEQGYAATSISQIAKRAGVLSGSIYWAFESKEQIFAAVLERASDEWEKKFDFDNIDWSEIPADLDEFQHGYMELSEAFIDSPEFVRLLMIVAIERLSGDNQIVIAAQKIRRYWRDYCSKLILLTLKNYREEDIKPIAERISRLVIQLMDGVFLLQNIEQDEIPLEELFLDNAKVLANELRLSIAELVPIESPNDS